MTTRGVKSSAELAEVLRRELARQQEVIPQIRARLIQELSKSRIWGAQDVLDRFDAVVREIAGLEVSRQPPEGV